LNPDQIKPFDLDSRSNNEDLYELLLSKQSVFDVSKETISLNQNSKLSSSMRSKNSIIMEAERSSKTLDILIKSTQQRHLKRNMAKNPTKEIEINNGIGEIEESLDIGCYQIAGVNSIDDSNSVKDEEDIPRQMPPTPEPTGPVKKPQIKIHDEPVIMESIESQRINSELRDAYKLINPGFKKENKEMIFIQNDFQREPEEEIRDKKWTTRKKTSSRNALDYPLRREGHRLMNTLDQVTRQAKKRVI